MKNKALAIWLAIMLLSCTCGAPLFGLLKDVAVGKWQEFVELSRYDPRKPWATARANFNDRFPQQPLDPAFYRSHLTRITTVQEALRAKAKAGLPECPPVPEGSDRTYEQQEDLFRRRHQTRLLNAWKQCEWSRRWARLGYAQEAEEAIASAEGYLTETGETWFERTTSDIRKKFASSPGSTPPPRALPWDPDLPDGQGDPKKWKLPKAYVPYAETANAESTSLQTGETSE